MNVFLKMLFLLGSWVAQGGVIKSQRDPRLSLAEPSPSYYYTNIDGVPGTYSFGYDVLDPGTGNTQYRNEEKYPNGSVVGSYGYIDANGKPIHFRYVADERGYRVRKVKPQLLPAPVKPILNIIPPYKDKQDSVTWSRKKLQSRNKIRKTITASNSIQNNDQIGNIYYSKNWQKPYTYY